MTMVKGQIEPMMQTEALWAEVEQARQASAPALAHLVVRNMFIEYAHLDPMAKTFFLTKLGEIAQAGAATAGTEEAARDFTAIAGFLGDYTENRQPTDADHNATYDLAAAYARSTGQNR